MAVILTAPFGDRDAVRAAEVANATFRRALKLGYSRVIAQALARKAKREAHPCETPSAVAMRIVRDRRASATCPMRPGPGGTVA